MYKPVRIKLNRYGHLELWKDAQHGWEPRHYGECDVYLQSAEDTHMLLSSLSIGEQEELDSGWTIITTNISEEYFTND